MVWYVKQAVDYLVSAASIAAMQPSNRQDIQATPSICVCTCQALNQID